MLAAIAAAIACTAPYVVDGDTLRCDGERVRLWGMDAPELHGPSHAATFPDGDPPAWVAPAARLRLQALTNGRVVCTEATPRDRYGRMVARCASAAEPDLGRALVREGLAVDWPRYSHGAYAVDQRRAREAGQGLWGR